MSKSLACLGLQEMAGSTWFDLSTSRRLKTLANRCWSLRLGRSWIRTGRHFARRHKHVFCCSWTCAVQRKGCNYCWAQITILHNTFLLKDCWITHHTIIILKEPAREKRAIRSVRIVLYMGRVKWVMSAGWPILGPAFIMAYRDATSS